MTNPEDTLNYFTPRHSKSGTRTAAWICTLLLGIAYMIAGTCVSIGLLSEMFGGRTDIGLACVSPLIAICVVASGIAYLYNSVRIQRRIRLGAEWVSDIAIANIIIFALLLILAWVVFGGEWVPALTVMGMIAILPNVLIAFLCRLAMKDPQAFI